jgi:2-dehydro-3-deoxyphosphogluconate aldolase/(4S)-4-hydroxy-2-oxoglutarate aldolase
MIVDRHVESHTLRPRGSPASAGGNSVNIGEIVKLTPVIPVVTITDLGQALPLAQSLLTGGVTVIEITLRTPVAFAVVEAIRKDFPNAIVGIGTLTRARDFAAADRAGAQFGVTPGLTPELAAASRGARFPLLPGVMTPTEVIIARNAGFNVLKLFPAHQAGGIGLLKAMAPVFPDVLFCPTGGITRETAPEYLRQPNVACIGSSWLAPDAMLSAGDWAGIETLAREALSLRERSSAPERLGSSKEGSEGVVDNHTISR